MNAADAVAYAATGRPPQIRIFDDEGIIDGFAGGGGTSTGIEMALGRSPDVAINHDPIALAMHEANHPETDHIVSNIRMVRYERLLPGKRVGLLWLSPDCTFHSKARGGKPFRDPQRARRIRGLAWEAVRAVKALGPRAPRVIMLENVEEWRDWCPLKGDRPDWTRRGESYRRWKRELAKAGEQATGRPYVIEDRELVACDYGAPTKRKRLFVIARCDGEPIVWPEPTHGPGREQPYRTAAECLDFSLPVPSIFLTQKQANAWAKKMGLPKASAPRRPLAPATKRRIARGVQRFVLDAPEPFIVKYHGEHYRVEGVDASKAGEFRGQAVSEPLLTLDTSNRFGLVVPVLAGVGGRKGQSPETPVDQPYHTITAKADTALVAPFLAPYYTERVKERHARTRGVDEPLPTITTQGGGKVGLITPFLAPLTHGKNGEGRESSVVYDVNDPLRTITCAARGEFALIAPSLVRVAHGERDGRGKKRGKGEHSVKEPLPTQTGSNEFALLVPRESLDASYVDRAVQTCAFIVKYFGTGVARPLDQPLGTLTTKDRIGLVQVVLMRVGANEYVLADIGMRMLTPRELFLCQGFPPGYEIEHVPSGEPTDLFGTKGLQKLTKKAQTRLVGNSVPPHVAAALIAANLAPQNAEAVA